MSTRARRDKKPTSQTSSSHRYIVGGNHVYTTHGTVNLNSSNGNTEDPDSELKLKEAKRLAELALKALQSQSAPDALHTSVAVSRQNTCTPGTRTVTLSNLESLATNSDPSSPDVIWMHGAAGAGKSAIMRTLANALDERGLLLASFFFFRSEAQRNTSRPFIPTLATRAWDTVPATQPHITQAIEENQDLFSRPAHLQSPHLLEKPLLFALTPPGAPLTIIVDGLDECTDRGGQTEIITAMVQLASTIRAKANRRVKIFIASRPEYEIESRFDALASDPAISIIRLDDSDANLHLFYDEQLDKIRQKFRLPSSWPSKEEIKWLLDKTSGQYSFAGVSTRFMYGGDPMRRLRIIQEALKDDKLKPFDDLDQLYATIFDQLPEDMRIPAVRILRCRLHTQWDSVDNRLLEPLLQLPPGYVHSLRAYLASLIDFDNDMASYHASLADFLVDPSRSGKFSLYVDDRTLSHTVQRSLLALFSSDGQRSTEYFDDKNRAHFWESCGSPAFFFEPVMVPHRLPSDELFSALQKIDPSLLKADFSNVCLFFLTQLQKQFRSQCLRHPVLWYTIRYALPRRLNHIERSRYFNFNRVGRRKKEFVTEDMDSLDSAELWYTVEHFEIRGEARGSALLSSRSRPLFM